MLYSNSYWLSILYIVACVYVNPKLLIYPSLPHFPFGNRNFVFEICESFCFVNKFFYIILIRVHDLLIFLEYLLL